MTEHGVDDEEYCAGNGGGDADVGGERSLKIRRFRCADDSGKVV